MNTQHADRVAQALALRDLTDPAAGEHAVQHVVTAVERARSPQRGRCQCAAIRVRGSCRSPTTTTGGYHRLPEAARQRIGLHAGQKNLLLRLVLRDLDRTLTSAEANALRDRVYAGLHEGTAHQRTTGRAVPV